MIVPVVILVPGMLGSLTARVAQLLENRGYSVMLLDEITGADLEAGLRYVDNDICAPTIAMIGQCIRWAEQHTGAEEISVLTPVLCHDCRSISLRDTLDVTFKRAGCHDVKLVELSSSELKALAGPAVEKAPIAHGTTIGLCGNVPVLTIEELRRTVCTHLENSGVSVVIPPLKRILDQQDFLTPSLEYFSEVGITHYQPSVSEKLTLENVKANTSIPFDWLLYAWKVVDMSDEAIQAWVDAAVEAGVSIIRTQIGKYAWMNNRQDRLLAFFKAFDKYRTE